jgi:hypothetical protein
MTPGQCYRSWRLRLLRHCIGCKGKHSRVMDGSVCRPHSREKVICQILTYCHANGFVHKHLVFFFVSSDARGRIYSTRAPKILATSLLLRYQSAILYAAGWHTYVALILWVSRSNVGWCSVILSHLTSYLWYHYTEAP